MTNAIAGFDRWTDKCTFSGGGWSSSYPVSNLNVLPVAKVARSTDLTLANTQFIATLDKQRPVRMLGLINHNLSLDAQVRITLYSDDAMTILLYDSGWVDAIPVVYPSDQLAWEDSNWWSGKYTLDEMQGYPITRPFWLLNYYLAKKIKVEINDQTNTAGFVQIGLFEVAKGWLFGVNFSFGSQYGFRFRTTSEEAEGGVKYFDRKDKPRVFKGTVNLMTSDEAKSKAFELFRQLDLDTPFLWMPLPDITIHWLRDVFLARLTDPGLITYSSYARDIVPIALEEVL